MVARLCRFKSCYPHQGLSRMAGTFFIVQIFCPETAPFPNRTVSHAAQAFLFPLLTRKRTAETSFLFQSPRNSRRFFVPFLLFCRCNMNFFNLSFPRPLWKDSFTIFLDKSKKAFIIKNNNYY